MFKSLFGGGTPYKTVQAPTPAAAAAPEDTSVAKEEGPNDALRKRKRGKASLYVTPTNDVGSGTGLNL